MYKFGRVMIILAIIILALWSRVDCGKSARLVDCEKYVFHPHCRGMQAKKRIIGAIENETTDKICMCKSDMGNSYRGKERDLLSDSKLLEAMLSYGFDIDTIYDAYSTYLSSSASKNRNDGSRGNSMISSGGASSSSSSRNINGNSHYTTTTSSSNSRSNSRSSSISRRHDNRVGNGERRRIPLPENTIDFINSDMDLDYLS